MVAFLVLILQRGKNLICMLYKLKYGLSVLTYFMSALKNCSLYLPSKTTFFLIVIMWFIHSIYKFEKSSLGGELCLATKAQKNFKTANVQWDHVKDQNYLIDQVFKLKYCYCHIDTREILAEHGKLAENEFEQVCIRMKSFHIF